jgi:hypothetical protein
VQQFPSNLVAGLFGFGNAKYFEIVDPSHRAVPEVAFQAMLRRLLVLVLLAALPGAAAADEAILRFEVASTRWKTARCGSPKRSASRPRATPSAAASIATSRCTSASPTARCRSVATVDILGVYRNGAPETCTVERNGATARLRIGRADRLLPVPSEQVYELTYRTEGQLRSQPEFDELFWNVTGMDWNFPIRAASVDILLPEGVPILRLGGLYRAARRAGHRLCGDRGRRLALSRRNHPPAAAGRRVVRVAPDYHVEADGCWYSVPFGLIRQEVDVRVSGTTVEIFHRGKRVASHARDPGSHRRCAFRATQPCHGARPHAVFAPPPCGMDPGAHAGLRREAGAVRCVRHWSRTHGDTMAHSAGS